MRFKNFFIQLYSLNLVPNFLKITPYRDAFDFHPNIFLRIFNNFQGFMDFGSQNRGGAESKPQKKKKKVASQKFKVATSSNY